MSDMPYGASQYRRLAGRVLDRRGFSARIQVWPYFGVSSRMRVSIDKHGNKDIEETRFYDVIGPTDYSKVELAQLVIDQWDSKPIDWPGGFREHSISADNPLILVLVGPSGCGKDASAKFLAELTRLRYEGSLSWMGLPYVAARSGVSEQVAWDSKRQCPELWRQYLDHYRQGDPGRLIRNTLRYADIIVGVRSAVEFAQVSALTEWTIWVDRPNCPVDPTLEVTPASCRYHIQNHGDLEELLMNWAAWCRQNLPTDLLRQ